MEVDRHDTSDKTAYGDGNGNSNNSDYSNSKTKEEAHWNNIVILKYNSVGIQVLLYFCTWLCDRHLVIS
jgi:hypothetical protein